MDPTDTRQLETLDKDYYWERFHRRNDPESSWYSLSDDLSEDFGTNQDTGDDVARKERMAEACYEL